MSERKAHMVIFAATAYAYQVQTIDENGSIMDDFTAGNHPGDSQAFVNADEGVGLVVMERMARQTASETAVRFGLEPTAIHEDRDLIEGLDLGYKMEIAD